MVSGISSKVAPAVPFAIERSRKQKRAAVMNRYAVIFSHFSTGESISLLKNVGYKCVTKD